MLKDLVNRYKGIDSAVMDHPVDPAVEVPVAVPVVLPSPKGETGDAVVASIAPPSSTTSISNPALIEPGLARCAPPLSLSPLL
jgi:hypothetical protein